MPKLTPDLVARLLAAVTAGRPLDRQPGGGGRSSAMDVLGALGMARTSAWGVAIILAKYTQDHAAAAEVERRALRFTWLTWLNTAPENHTITVTQAKALAGLVTGHHLDPSKRRRANLRGCAKALGVHHQTYRAKFLPHYQRLFAELLYQEETATRELLRKLG